MKVVIIVPTYNEHDNISILIQALQDQFYNMHHNMHILVVDDNSPDGTAEVVRGLQTSHDNLHLIMGRKAGLGIAYLRGMQYAINSLNADVVFEMDADLSHKPQDIPRLMAEIDHGADFVIGSRYVRGGSIPKEWRLYRRLNSYFGNIAARYIAGIYHVKDCTAGFRAIRTSLLKRIDLNGIYVKGYTFQVALLHRVVDSGAMIREIPVDFVDRKYGDSKLGLSDILEFIMNVWRIRLNRRNGFSVGYLLKKPSRIRGVIVRVIFGILNKSKVTVT